MSDKVQAAAERLTKLPNWENRLDHFDVACYVKDLVAAVQAEHPPDAAEPLSEDVWAEARGLAISVTKTKQGRWWAEAQQDGNRIVLCEITSKGQLRRLLSELDIALIGQTP